MNTQNRSVNYRDYKPEAIADLLMESLVDSLAFAERVGYRINGDLPEREAILDHLLDTSQSQNKRLIKWHFRLKRKLSMRSANRFLHAVCVKLLAYDADVDVARIDYSEREAAIKAARKAWVKARDEAETLRLAYVEEKGDFYRQ
jgi:hypothetical protein